MCSSGIPNKLIHVEKISPFYPPLFAVPFLATIIAAISSSKQFKTCFVWGVK